MARSVPGALTPGGRRHPATSTAAVARPSVTPTPLDRQEPPLHPRKARGTSGTRVHATHARAARGALRQAVVGEGGGDAVDDRLPARPLGRHRAGVVGETVREARMGRGEAAQRATEERGLGAEARAAREARGCLCPGVQGQVEGGGDGRFASIGRGARERREGADAGGRTHASQNDEGRKELFRTSHRASFWGLARLRRAQGPSTPSARDDAGPNGAAHPARGRRTKEHPHPPSPRLRQQPAEDLAGACGRL